MKMVEIFKIIIEFINNFWYKKYVYLYSIIMPLVAYIIRLPNYNVKSKKTWLEIVLILITYILCIIIPIALKRRIPHFRKNKKTILFSIDAENEADIKVIKEKFIKEFEYSISQQHNDYKVATLNKFQANKLNLKLLQEGSALLDIYNIEFVIYGICKKGEDEESISYLLNFNGIEFKKPVIEGGKKIIKKEIKDVFIPMCDIKIRKQSINNDFEYNAEKLNLLMDYIIGTVFLMSQEFEISSDKYCDLKKRLSLYKKNDKMINIIKNVIDNRVFLACIFAANDKLLEYSQVQEKTILKTIKEQLDKISHKYHNYYYHQIYAIYDFLYDRNIKSATIHIDECSKCSINSDWKFSKTFLKLYESNTITNLCAAYKTYKKLFEQNNYSIEFMNWILDFIYMILDEEPEKTQLHFLIGLLYHFYFNNDQLKEQHYKTFLENNAEKANNDSFRQILLKIQAIEESNPQLSIA